MSSKLSKLSIAEIRDRYVTGSAAVSPQLLGRLKRDPRAGVQRIYEQLRKRHEAEREERLRMEAMLHFERVLWKSGVERVAGVDEAGVGPLAGPVVAAAVVFPPGTEIAGVDDSKRLDAAARTELVARIRQRAAGVGVGRAEVAEIDRLNVYHAALLAMRRAVEALPEPPQHVLVDAREIPDLEAPQNTFDKGDGLNFSIAAASIVAKTERDAHMVELDRLFPDYGFASHKGYGTAAHQEAIAHHGPCEAHRLSYPFIRELCGEFSDLFYDLRERLGAIGDRDSLAAFETELDENLEALGEAERRKLKLMVRRAWDRV